MFLLDFVKLVIYRVLDNWNLHGGISFFSRIRTPLGPYMGCQIRRK
jgi:hypothetical protein